MPKNMAAERLEPDEGNSADCINRDLVAWFAEHGCAWSGTLSELVGSLNTSDIVSHKTLPLTANSLYAHLRLQSETLRSYGIDVTLYQSCPRMVSLKPCEKAQEQPVVVDEGLDIEVTGLEQGPGNSSTHDAPIDGERLVNDDKCKTPPSDDARRVLLAISEMQEQIQKRLKQSDSEPVSAPIQPYLQQRDAPSDIGPTSKGRAGDPLFTISAVEKGIRERLNKSASDPLKENTFLSPTTLRNDGAIREITDDRGTHFAAITDAPVGTLRNDPPDDVENMVSDAGDLRDNDSEAIFENAGEALLAVVEIQEQLRHLGPETTSVIDAAAEKTQQMSRASGVAIALAREGKLLYRTETGLAREIIELQCDSSVMRSCLETGKILQLQDTENDNPVRESCLRERIKSLIISPLPVGEGFVGAIEFIFQEKRSLQNADVITIGVVADAIATALTQA
jgi:hypothetical protein